MRCALRGAGEMNVSARPNDRRAAHGRHADRSAIAPAEKFDVAWRQRRHDAVTRDKLDGVQRRPVALDPGIVLARPAVGIFKRKMRNVGARALPQIGDAGISADATWRSSRIAAIARRAASPAAPPAPWYRAWAFLLERHYSALIWEVFSFCPAQRTKPANAESGVSCFTTCGARAFRRSLAARRLAASRPRSCRCRPR